jgi:CRP/FNR family transcriptional regulator
VSKPVPSQRYGPSLRATDPWLRGKPSQGKQHQLLSEDEKARLATLASIVRFKKNERIYREGESAGMVFNIISGVVGIYKKRSKTDRHIVAFLSAEDIFGLAEEGQYVNSAFALNSVTAYCLPVPALRRLLSSDAGLDVHVIVKLCQELRQAQRQALIVVQKNATTRLAMFLSLQEHLQSSRNELTTEIYLPMDRTAIAEYIGLSLATVSRAFRALADTALISHRNRRHIKVVDRKAFEKLAKFSVEETSD